MIELFPVDKVNQMRCKLETARAPAGDTLKQNGWHKSDLSPNVLLETLESLWLKEGYTLRGYLYKSGENGNGIVWAMPIDSPFPEPSECTSLTDQFLEPPKPEHALDDFMEAIDGDHTAWSYMCSSILGRELLEFGARWHGCEWSYERIVSFKKLYRICRLKPITDKSFIYNPIVIINQIVICSLFTIHEQYGFIKENRDIYQKGNYENNNNDQK